MIDSELLELSGGEYSPTLFTATDERKGYVSAEVLLWRAVIERAFRDAFGHCSVPEVEQKLLQHQAIQWLTGHSADYREVCDMAQVHPLAIHRAFLAAQEANDINLALKEIR